MEKTTPAPVEKVSVPVKPLLGTVANTVALGAAGVAAGGTTAMVALAAGTTAVAAAMKGGKKYASARSQRRASGASGSGRSGIRSGMFRSGKGAGTGAAKTKTGTSGARTGTGATGAGARKAKTGIAGIGRSLPKGSGSGKTGGTGARPSVRRASGSGKSTPARSGSSGRPGSLASRARRVANSPARKWAGQKITGAARKTASGFRSGAARTDAAARRARQKVWNWLRKFVQRKIMGRDPEAAKKTLRQNAARDIKADLARGLINPPYAPQYARNIIAPLGTTSSITNECQGGTMKHHAQQILEYAAEWEGRNLLEIIDEIDANTAPTIQLVAEAYGVIAEKCRNSWGFDDAIVHKYNLISECLHTAAQMAATITSDIEITEEAAINRLRNPGTGEHLRDLSAHGMA